MATPRIEYLTDAEVAAALRVSRSTVWNYVRRGLLPKPKRIGKRCSRWPAPQLERFLGRAS